MRIRGRQLMLVVLVIVAPFAVYGYRKWHEAGEIGGQKYAKPFRIAGNFYYVGANDIAAFLITGPQGHILIDGGYPRTPALIIASIAELGFNIKDVKVLLNSETHPDHAGGLAELQRVSGAQLWASKASAQVLAAGGDDPATFLPIRAFFWLGVFSYPSPRVDHVFKDGDTIRVGPVEVTARITPGHTKGCTSFVIPVQDSGRVLQVVSACSLIKMGAMSYEGQKADFERTFQTLRGIPADIWVTSHARLFGRYRKFVARDSIGNPADAFIDREGYRAYIDKAQAEFRKGVVH